jgi:AcrR family transcriptional regulator
LSSKLGHQAGKSRPRGRRGLDKGEILAAAVELLAAEGEEGFSVRKLGAQVGVDPMTVLHHFRSKDDLLRAIADCTLAAQPFPLPSECWQEDLRAVATAYRTLAHKYPKIFHLHFRFHSTGPADHVSSEIVYRAMRKTGLPDSITAGLGLSFYAFVLGLGLAETGGLLMPLRPEEEAELKALDPLACPATQAFIPAFKSLDPTLAYNASVEAFIMGIERLQPEHLISAKSAKGRRAVISTVRA